MVAIVPAFLLFLTAGCKSEAKTPQEAIDRFATAVIERDSKDLYLLLDLETRWSWMTIRRAQRESYDIVLSNFDEGPDRDRQLLRLADGALSQDEATLFGRWMTAERWQALADRIPLLGSPVIDGDQATVPAGDGPPLPFARGENGSWGYAGFRPAADAMKTRASNDLKVMRQNAADYERAARRHEKTKTGNN